MGPDDFDLHDVFAGAEVVDLLAHVRDAVDDGLLPTFPNGAFRPLPEGALTSAGAPITFPSVDDTMTSTAAPTITSLPGGRMARQNAIQVQNAATGTTEPQYIDVELHGVQVPLMTLKRVLRQDKKLRQQEIAALTAPHNGGKELHQTSVSGYLIGKVEMHPACVAALEGVFTAAEATSMASNAPLAVPVASLGTATVLTPAPASGVAQIPATPRGPVFANTLAAVGGGAPLPPDTTGLTPGAATPTVGATLAALAAFPKQTAYELVEAVRTALKSGEVATTFSLRKLQAWAGAYYLLQREDYSANEALAGAFHLAVEGKTYGEDKRFLRDLFQAKFGFESKPPKEHSRTALREGRHPMSYLIEPLLREGRHVWLHGPTGSGKTHTVKDLARRLGRPMIRFQGKGDATTDDFVGGFAAVNENGVPVTQFQYGVLPLAMQQGAILNIDEITALPAEVLFELQAVLEGDNLVLSKNRGEVVAPQPGFVVVASDNSLGLGEATEYIGTNVMNEAFRDRFYFVEFGYMPESHEMAALDAFTAKFLGERGWAVA